MDEKSYFTGATFFFWKLLSFGFFFSHVVSVGVVGYLVIGVAAAAGAIVELGK